MAVAALIASVYVGLWDGQAAYAADQDWENCRQQVDRDRSIAGCTAVLRRGTRESASNRADAYVWRGIAYNAKGAYDLAIADYDAAIRLNPTYAIAFYNRGVAYYDKGAYDRAIVDYDEAIRINPRNADAFNDRGRAYGAKGAHDRAIADYDEAIRINPKLAYLFSNRGVAYYYKGAYDRAIADYNEAIRLDPKLVLAFNGRGNAYAAKGAYDQAIADLNEAIRLDPKLAYPYRHRGHAYLQKGDLDRALADLNEALRLRPDYLRALERRAAVYAARGEHERALADYDAALASTSVVPFITLDNQDRTRALAGRAAAQAAIAARRAPVLSGVAPSPVRETRMALVIGNGAYSHTRPLPNPDRDADAVAQTLTRIGFTVTTHKNLDRRALLTALNAFADASAGADWAIVYFAGHGMEINGTNYLIPIDAALKTDRDIPDEAVPLDRALTAVAKARRLRLVVLDACRDNPFVRTMRMTENTRSADQLDRGLGLIEPTGGTLVAYAAKHGLKAHDGNPGENSPFVASFVRRIVEPGVEIGMTFRRIRDDVLKATDQKQEPYLYGSISSDGFFFVGDGRN